MIFSEHRYTPVGPSPEGMLFRIMLYSPQPSRQMEHFKNKTV